VLGVVLLVAAVLRLTVLDGIPPGPGYDELQDARLSERVLAGEWAIYYSENFGQEPLYPALAALSVHLLGWSVTALRLPGALLGLVSVVAVYLIAKQLFCTDPHLCQTETDPTARTKVDGRYVALLAAIFQAISFWPLIETRMALETTLLPPMAALAVFFIVYGLSRISRSSADHASRLWLRLTTFLIAGLLVGGQVYAYTPGRVMPLLIPALLLYLFLLDRLTLRRRWRGLCVLCVVAVLTIMPLFLFLRTHPDAEQRLDQLQGPLDAVAQGDLGPILHTTAGTLGMFSLRGESQWLYNVAERPVFDHFTALFFYFGLVLCLVRFRDWRYGLLLIWLLVGLAPAFVSPPAASFTHTLIAQPAVYLILSIGAAGSMTWVARWRKWVGWVLALLLIILNAVSSWQAYFGTWANAPQVRELYQAGITAVANDLDARDLDGPVSIGAPYIDFWHSWNVLGFELQSSRDDLNVRWFDPSGGWVWPVGEGARTYYFPTDPLGSQVFDPGLERGFHADAVAYAAVKDLFSAYQVVESSFLEQRLEAIGRAAVAWPPQLRTLSPPALPLNVGQRFLLLGAELQNSPAAPGETLRLITYWAVLASDASPVVAFAHLTSDGLDIWGQHDGLDVRPASLLPGDRFAQVHPVTINPGTPSGAYHLQIGLYSPETLVRLPIQTADGGFADRVWVADVEVNAE
jgi:4-amino-4-deoxy-L-arabinose transferase-like glycosyltransferase